MFAGLRATWSNSRGAVAFTSWRASPRGNRTRSPSMSQPAPRISSSASGASRKSIPTCSRIVSALCSIVATPSSLSTSTGRELPGDEGHPLRDGLEPRRRAAFPPAAASPSRCRRLIAHVLLLSGRTRGGDGVGALPPARSAGPAGPRPRRAAGTDPTRGGCPSRRRNAPGTAAPPRSRSSRPGARPSRSRRGRPGSATRCERPVPAALPALVTCSGSQSGTSPRTSACNGSMWAPNAPASRMRSTWSIPNASISSRQPA